MFSLGGILLAGTVAWFFLCWTIVGDRFLVIVTKTDYWTGDK